MTLKFQDIIDELDISATCPPTNLEKFNAIAFRWVYTPLTHALNFLPNYPFDKARGLAAPYSTYSATKKCSRCSQSFFTTLDAAKINHRKLSKIAKDSLGYTHIANGLLESSDGDATKINDSGHFGFYEYDTSDLISKFQICDELDSWL